MHYDVGSAYLRTHYVVFNNILCVAESNDSNQIV